MNQPVPLKTLAKELGLTYAALRKQARKGNIPTTKLRNLTIVDPHIAQQIRQWHATKTNPNTRWPQFPLKETQ